MAGKAKSMYVSVIHRDFPAKTIEKQVFFNAKQANDWIKLKQEQYPVEDYRYIKETY